MQIQSLIRPSQKPTRTVTVFGKAYVFAKTVDDKFVAEVDDPAAIETLLKLPKAYRQYTPPKPAISRTAIDPADPESVAKAAAQAAALKAEQEQAEADEAAAAAAAAQAVAKQEANEAADAQKNAVEAEVLALLSSTPQAIKKIVEKKVPSKDVLTRALAVEKGAEKPRPQVVNLLSGTLASLETE